MVRAFVPEAKALQPAKKGKKAAITPDELVLQVMLHDTIIFPEGGGQPSDVGVIVLAEETWQVTEVKRIGGHAVHSVRLAPGKDIEYALKAFSAGIEVNISLGEEGFKRRLDHVCLCGTCQWLSLIHSQMTLHTSQHLLSAILEQRLDLPTLSWSLTAYPSPCYVEIPRGMTPDEIASIQDETNRLVFEGRKVHVEVEELSSTNLPGVARLENGRSAGKALPSDYTGGVKRTIVIEGVDRNP